MKMFCLLATVLLIAFAGTAWAESDTATQTVTAGINEIAVIDAIGSPGDMVISRPDFGGEEPAAASGVSSYLQYTSIIHSANSESGASRKINAQITTGDLPAGTSLTLSATPGSGGVGIVGTGRGVQDLGKVSGAYPAQDLVQGIKNCWTLTSPAKGAKLAYVFKVSNWSEVVATDFVPITVTFTLLAEQ